MYYKEVMNIMINKDNLRLYTLKHKHTHTHFISLSLSLSCSLEVLYVVCIF